MFFSHQILARKAPLGQIWMAATLHAKINRKKLDKLDIIQICEEILNPSIPMALRLSGILMGGVVIVYERKVKLLLEDAVRLQVEINGAWRTKAVRDPTLLPKGKTHARKETITLPENENAEEADFGDFEQPRSIPKFPNHQTYISMRLDEYTVNENPEPGDLREQLHQADPADITLSEYHCSFQANTDTYDRFERFDIEGDDETQMNIDPQPAEIPSTLIPSPPRHHEIPEVRNPTEPQRQIPEEHVTNVFAEQMEEQHIPNREEQAAEPRPTKRKARKTTTIQMDYEQTIISGPEYQARLQDASDILCKGEKRKARGTITTAMKISKLMDMPPVVLCFHQRDKEHVDNFYPPQIYELLSKDTQPLQKSASHSPENQRPDFFEEQSTAFVHEGIQNNYQPEQQGGTELNSQNLGSLERLRTTVAAGNVSIERLMAERRAMPENSNRQAAAAAADISVTAFYSGDDVRSLPSTPSARGVAASSNTEINSKRVSRKRPHSSPRRGLEPVAEDRHAFDFEFTMAPENGFNADIEILAETGPTQTQKLLFNPAEEKKTESIKSHLKTHFETPGNPQVESLNKLATGMTRNAAAQLFYQSCVLATRGDIKVKQVQPYGDILIERGPKM